MTVTDIVTVSIACASDEDAQSLARGLVEQRLAACVQTAAVTSTYRWQGAIETAPEILLTAKTLVDKLPALETFVKTQHSYKVPEILATPVVWGSAEYIRWMRENLA